MESLNIDFKQRLINLLDITEKELIKEDYKFVILFDESEEGINSFDNIMYPWILLPKKADIELTLDEVVKALNTTENRMPLWIKVNIQNNKIITLCSSKRIRNAKQAVSNSNNPELFPFSKNNNPDIFDEEKKRKGIVKRLMWFFELEQRYCSIFENHPLSETDIDSYFNWHFKHYLFFPADYKNDRVKEKRFPKHVIRLVPDCSYKIIRDFEKIREKTIFETEDLVSLTNFYVKKVLKHEIGSLKIQKVKTHNT